MSMGAVFSKSDKARSEVTPSSSHPAAAVVWSSLPMRWTDAGVLETSRSGQGQERVISHANESATSLETSMIVDSRVRVRACSDSFSVGSLKSKRC